MRRADCTSGGSSSVVGPSGQHDGNEDPPRPQYRNDGARIGVIPQDEDVFLKSRRIMVSRRVAAEFTDRRLIDSGQRLEDVDPDEAANRITTGFRARLYDLFNAKVNNTIAILDQACLVLGYRVIKMVQCRRRFIGMVSISRRLGAPARPCRT